MTTIVTESNLISIPPDIARDFDIHPGTQLQWAKTGEGAILITPLPSRGDLARQLMGAGKRWLKSGDNPIEDLVKEREQDDKINQADERQ